MKCYLVTGDLDRRHPNYAKLSATIKSLDPQADQPHDGAWLVRTSLTASELRARLIPYVDFANRLFICEAGEDSARFNALQPAGRRNVIQFEGRRQSQMLRKVLAGARPSRMLTAAIAGNSK